MIIGSVLRGSIIETSDIVPKIRIDETGISFQVSTAVGTWGDFIWGDGTLWGTGYLATLFNKNFPAFAVLAESTMADIRLYNRSADPVAGTHTEGDLIIVNDILKSCRTAGTPGEFQPVGNVLENLTADPASPVVGQIWIRTDI